MTLLAAVVLSGVALAQNKTINVVDDVGVGDHFPSQVPGTGPYRLQPRDTDVAPPAPEQIKAEVVEMPAQAVREKPASDPSEWAAPPQVAAQPAPAAQPVAVPAPAPQPAPVVQQPVPAQPEAASPPPSISRDLAQTTLEQASNSLLQGTCETELPRLAELLERTDSRDTAARARVLRARCFTQRAKPAQAKAEYLLYLRDFPNGRWAAEARDLAN